MIRFETNKLVIEIPCGDMEPEVVHRKLQMALIDISLYALDNGHKIQLDSLHLLAHQILNNMNDVQQQ